MVESERGSEAAAPPPMRIGGFSFEWGRRTYVMGVLNITPDSFSGDGVTDVAAASVRARELVAAGADILDIGGESTRPGAQPVSLEEELRRVLPVVTILAGELGVPISVDTMKAEVARQALRAGSAMINDVSALRADPQMAAVLAAAEAPLVLMHGYGTSPERAQDTGGDVVSRVRAFLEERIEAATAARVPRDLLLIDPGFGFGKTVRENLEILRRLREFRRLGRPLLIGTSRKGTIGQVLGGLPVHERLEGTAATVAVAIMNGADIIRVHDVRAMVRVARMTDAIVRPYSCCDHS